MALFIVVLSDTRTDLPVGWTGPAPEIWGYEIVADTAEDAVPVAIERWREEVGDRTAVSISVTPLRKRWRIIARCTTWQPTDCMRMLGDRGITVGDTSALVDVTARKLASHTNVEIVVSAWDEKHARERALAALRACGAGCTDLSDPQLAN